MPIARIWQPVVGEVLILEREPTNQYQGPPSGIAVVKTAVMVGHSLHFVFPIPFKNIQLGQSGSHRRCLWHGGALRKAYLERLKKDYYRKQS